MAISAIALALAGLGSRGPDPLHHIFKWTLIGILLVIFLTFVIVLVRAALRRTRDPLW